MAVGKRPSPSAAPLEDWPCGVFGSGFTTQQRLRSPTAGALDSRSFLPMEARKTPSPRHLCRIAAIKPEPPASESPEGQLLRMRCCKLEGTYATKDVATRRRARVVAWKPNQPCVACRQVSFRMERHRLSPPNGGGEDPLPPKGGRGIIPPGGGSSLKQCGRHA